MNQYIHHHQYKRRITFLVVVFVALLVTSVAIFAIIDFRVRAAVSSESSVRVAITSRTPVPSTVSIKTGETVTWINRDDKPHTLVLTSASPPPEMRGFGTEYPLAKDEIYTYTFDIAGKYTYNDPLDPESIKGTIIVE